MLNKAFAANVIIITLLIFPIVGMVDENDSPSTPGERYIIEYLKKNPEFLLNNPDLIERSLKLSREREEARQTLTRRNLLEERSSDLLSPESSPNRGNKNAKFTLIEFSDYQCIPCKQSFPAVEEILEKEPGLKVIHLQLPIYGDDSILAAKAAIAAHLQRKFEVYHAAMIRLQDPLSWTTIKKTATSVGIDVNRMEIDMMQSKVTRYLEQIRYLAEELGVSGTPTFFINGTIIRGGVDVHKLKTVLERLE